MILCLITLKANMIANMASTRLPNVENEPSKIQLERISHVYFEHIDLQKFETFAADFGLVEAWRDEDTILYRGYGQDQYCYVARRAKTSKPTFQGPAFVAQNADEFEKAAAMEGAVISDLSPFPGGGKAVTLKTPAGFYFRVIHGQEDRKSTSEIPTAQVENLGPLNGSKDKQRYGRPHLDQRKPAAKQYSRRVPKIPCWPSFGPQIRTSGIPDWAS